ncbi:MAG: hypothetical protein WBG73_10540 [Coleofasciculaceae cyanobacterium]
MNIRHFTQKKSAVLATLTFTSLISASTSMTFVNSASAKSLESVQNATGLKQSIDNSLPVGVVTAVSREIVRSYRVSQNQLRVVKFSQETWSNSCLGLGRSNESCLESLVKGWRVAMTDGRQTWTYRTDTTGRLVRQEAQGTSNSSNLPQAVSNLVLRTAAQRTGLNITELRIVKTEQLTVDGCLGLARPKEPCTRIAQRAWEVTVEARQQRLVYRTNENATQIRFNEAASNITETNLPQTVSRAVLRAAALDLKIPAFQLQISKAEQNTWENSCLGLQRPNERCMGTPTPGWRVTVSGRQQVKVYRTDSTGDRIRAEETSNISDLPNSVQNAVLRDLANRTRFNISTLRIVQAERQQWSDGCLGLGGPNEPCTANIVPGWRVTVEGGRQTFIYRTNESGSIVKLEPRGLQGNNGTVPIPRSEIQPLGAGVVFRAIASGGFAGITTETFLMNDGRVMQSTSFRNQRPTQINQISRQEVQQFQRLLEQNRFSQFDLVSFPAPSGAADFITVTLTGDSTTRYADIVQNELPESLRSVTNAWSQIARRG